MAKNKLFEAAADILAGSKKSAPADAPQKLDGTVEDLGGPTPQNYKAEDDSAKLKAPSADKSGHNQGTLKMNASDAKSEVVDHLNKEEVEIDSEEVDFSDDINALFADDKTISEEFRSKAATIFEARVTDRVNQIAEEMESSYASMLEEAVETIKTDLTEKVDSYLNYVVEQWMQENEIAIESALRSELTEDFITGLRNLFAEHFISVPEEKVELVDELAEKVVELESSLNEEIERNVEMKKILVESLKNEIVHEVCQDLTQTQVEKIKTLAESVDFSTEEEYKEKLETIKENYFPSGVKKAQATQLNETVEDGSENKKQIIDDPFVAAVSKAISKTKI